jgi:hypothetical protein
LFAHFKIRGAIAQQQLLLGISKFNQLDFLPFTLNLRTREKGVHKNRKRNTSLISGKGKNWMHLEDKKLSLPKSKKSE